MHIIVRRYFAYKYLNAIFGGAVTGSVFTVYALLEPSLFSLGGIIVAIGVFIVAKLYGRLMNPRRFFEVTMATEILTLCSLVLFISLPKSYVMSLGYFWLYQCIFIFGIYLVRAESYLLRHIALLSMADRLKQKGYIVGLIISYGFYKGAHFLGVYDSWNQVWYLYLFLSIVQIVIIALLFRAFSGSNKAV